MCIVVVVNIIVREQYIALAQYLINCMEIWDKKVMNDLVYTGHHFIYTYIQICLISSCFSKLKIGQTAIIFKINTNC